MFDSISLVAIQMLGKNYVSMVSHYGVIEKSAISNILP